jgi:hypothetical protein
MSKEQKSDRADKKKPVMTPKERKAAKRSRKQSVGEPMHIPVFDKGH